MEPKVIKASELIKLRASIRKKYRRVWGFDIYNDVKVMKMGEHESNGSESYDQTIVDSALLSLLDGLIKKCKPLG